ncbi:MAG TPA: heme A synthase [Aeromonadales bacterium]|nr:heme A synthase [Aeromonadales bacterium]
MLAEYQYLKLLRTLALLAAVLALVVVMLGAYTRLKDAGLGCPDWPGCYGSLVVPSAHHEIAAAAKAFPERPVEGEKAWAEMIHRYFASTLGFLILIMAGYSWYRKKQHLSMPVVLPSILLILVIFQGMLGMWTVTMKLNPVIVMSHLLGGMTTFSLLVSFALLLYFYMQKDKVKLITMADAIQFKKIALVALLVLILQIALGGWTSANYAAQVCTDFPFCQGNWVEHLKPLEAFQLWGHGAENYEFGVKSLEAKTTIHVTHRIWSLVTLFTLLFLAIKLLKTRELLHQFGVVILFVVCVQFLLGIANVAFDLPLVNAVAHNGVGAILLASLVALNLLLRAARQVSQGEASE